MKPGHLGATYHTIVDAKWTPKVNLLIYVCEKRDNQRAVMPATRWWMHCPHCRGVVWISSLRRRWANPE